jgi:hypothetical protein
VSTGNDTPQPGTPEREATRIANIFEGYGRGGHWELAGDQHESPFGAARVCRVVPARVLHVVGASEMAEQLRALYSAGTVTGWTLQPMPGTRTPLHTVERAIHDAGGGTSRGYTQLTRGGFVHTEEVQACPDAALREVHNVGPGTLAIIRAVLPFLGPDPDAVADPGDVAGGDAPAVPQAARVAELFSPAARASCPQLVDELAAARVPDAALQKIAGSLSDEPVPPADPLVDLLLDTAGLRRALAVYRATHTTDQQ